MKSLRIAGVFVPLLALANAGCGPTSITVSKKPAYADLVVTYNAELETMEKLEEKRKALIADYFSQTQEEAIRAVVSSLESGGAQEIPSNPDLALDQAVAAAQTQAKLQSGLVQGLGLSSDSEESEADFPEELKGKLTDLDAEIADQQARVQRAKAARDAAQP